MHISFKRTGGFAGLAGPGQSVELRAADLPPEKAQRMQELVAAARFFDQPPQPGSSAAGSQVRDGFQYDVSIDDGERSHTVQVRDGSMPPEIAPLVQWLDQEARDKARQP